MTSETVGAWAEEFVAWRQDRAEIAEIEANGPPFPRPDDWAGSDDAAVDLLGRAATLLGVDAEPPATESKYRLIGNYGTFEIQRIVMAADRDEAWSETGIVDSLIDEGWGFTSFPEGEEWTIEKWVNGAWVLLSEEEDEG